MGAHGSWAIFSLCHHLLVQWCASMVYPSRYPLEGERFFEHYGLLGDDIMIADPLVYNHYVETNLSPAPTISIGYS